MIKCTKEDHEDYPSLTKAVGEIEAIVNLVNKRTKRMERMNSLLKLKETIGNSEVIFFHNFLYTQPDKKNKKKRILISSTLEIVT